VNTPLATHTHPMTPAIDLTSRRVLVAVPIVLAMLSMIGPFSIDTPFPAFTEMGEKLSASQSQLQLVVTAYMLAFAVMSVFHGPLSDALGRKPVMIGGTLVFVAASIGCAFAPSLEWLLVGRAAQGVSAGAATIVSRTIIRDLFDGPQAQRLMSRVVIIFGVAPAIAPVIGGFLVQIGPWQGIFWFLAVLGLVLIAATAFVLPESHPPENRVPLQVGELMRGLVEVARVPAFHRIAWAGTLVFGAQFFYIGGAAIVMVDLLGQGELDFWKLFVPMIGSMMFGSWLSGRAAGVFTIERVITLGYVVSVAGAFLGMAVALTPWGDVLPWAVIGVSLVAFGNGVAFPNIQLIMLDLVPHRRGAVASLGTFITLCFNAVGAVTITPWAAQSVEGLALAALVCVVAGAALWWWHELTTTRESVSAAVPR
jgi:DHA1 family bicyclomycin/chloramphenicol resistance-like MFS transporter